MTEKEIFFYNLEISGIEIGGGSIQIYNLSLLKERSQMLCFTDEESQKQFGFLTNTFEYGIPPLNELEIVAKGQ